MTVGKRVFLLIFLGGALAAGAVFFKPWYEVRGYYSAADELKDLEKEAESLGIPVTQAAHLKHMSIPADQNAAPFIEEAIESYKKTNNDIVDKITESQAALDANSQSQAKAVISLLQTIGPIMQKFEKISTMPGVDFERVYDPEAKNDFVQYNYMRRFARYFSLRSQARMILGDQAGALKDIQTSYGLARLISFEGNLNSASMAFRSLSATDLAVGRLIASGMKSPGFIQKLNDICQKDRKALDFEKIFKSEVFFTMEFVRGLEEWGPLAFMYNNNPDEENPFTTIPARVPHSTVRKAFLSRYLAQMINFYKDAGKPVDQAKLARDIEKLNMTEISIADKSNLILKVTMSGYGECYDTIEKLEAQSAVLKGLLAVAKYRSEKGSLPKTLEETGVKVIDPYTGEPIKYVPAASSYMVYSVGWDKKDDKGFNKPKDVDRRYDVTMTVSY